MRGRWAEEQEAGLEYVYYAAKAPVTEGKRGLKCSVHLLAKAWQGAVHA